MMNKLTFTSNHQYQTLLNDTAYWKPIITAVLEHHGLAEETSCLTAGFNSTYPVFLTKTKVIKFFGHRKNWQATFINECEAHKCLSSNKEIYAPPLIARGHLFENSKQPWAYTIAIRALGDSWLNSDLTQDQKVSVVSELGAQLYQIHSLPVNPTLKQDSDWESLDIKGAARKSVLPHHLIDQIDDFLKKLGPFDKVLTHGDLVGMHLFINNHRLSGIIDWGDACVTDRHYELAKLMNLFPCDKTLLKVLLNSASWPVTKNFPTQSLGLALYRQAVGLTQHFSFDVFYQLPNLLPLNEIKSLEELADELFKV